LRYVLNNGRKHGTWSAKDQPDPFSSGRWFHRWMASGGIKRPLRRAPVERSQILELFFLAPIRLDDLPGPRQHDSAETLETLLAASVIPRAVPRVPGFPGFLARDRATRQGSRGQSPCGSLAARRPQGSGDPHGDGRPREPSPVDRSPGPAHERGPRKPHPNATSRSASFSFTTGMRMMAP